MRPTDPIFQRYVSESFIFGSEVYHWRLCADAETLAAIGPFLDAWTSYPLNATVTRSSRIFSPGEQVTGDAIRQLAVLTEDIVVGAYDNEGYLVLRFGGHRQTNGAGTV